MIERYTLFEIEKLRDTFQLPDGVPAGVKKTYNISPTQLAPVIVRRDGNRVMERRMWGFIPASAKDTQSVFRYKTTTAKSESIFTKPTWSSVIRTQRCLVPANGYYEWRKTIDGKRPFYIQLKDQPLIAFAGIYSSWTNPEGDELGTFAIITTDDDSHTGRSPIIIDPADETDWLNPQIEDENSIYGMMRILSPDVMLSHKVTSDLKNAKLNSSALLEKIDETSKA